MTTKTKVEILRQIIQQLANERPIFFETKGEGAGNHDTNEFIAEVRRRARQLFGCDYSEQKICGDNQLAVDYYFEDEATIVEIALGIDKSNSEFEKDILKALLVQESHSVIRLVLIGKPGSVNVCKRRGRNAFSQWALKHHNLIVDVYDIDNIHTYSNIESL
jgi:uncharacterized protein (DUF111 family)